MRLRPGNVDGYRCAPSVSDKLIDKWLSSDKIAELGIFDEAKLRASIEDYRQSDDHTQNTRKDIILNHAIALHAMGDLLVQ